MMKTHSYLRWDIPNNLNQLFLSQEWKPWGKDSMRNWSSPVWKRTYKSMGDWLVVVQLGGYNNCCQVKHGRFCICFCVHVHLHSCIFWLLHSALSLSNDKSIYNMHTLWTHTLNHIQVRQRAHGNLCIIYSTHTESIGNASKFSFNLIIHTKY